MDDKKLVCKADYEAAKARGNVGNFKKGVYMYSGTSDKGHSE